MYREGLAARPMSNLVPRLTLLRILLEGSVLTTHFSFAVRALNNIRGKFRHNFSCGKVSTTTLSSHSNKLKILALERELLYFKDLKPACRQTGSHSSVVEQLPFKQLIMVRFHVGAQYKTLRFMREFLFCYMESNGRGVGRTLWSPVEEGLGKPWVSE